MGMMPAWLTTPTVGLVPATPLALAGLMIEPSVSVPMARAANPAATPAPDPELEPLGVRSSTCGFLVWRPRPLHPELERLDRMLAHSLRLALPISTAPARRRVATSGASRRAGAPGIASGPAAVNIPAPRSTLSLP